MTEERFAAWLAPFNLSQNSLLQCLELGQAVLHRRKTEATEREKSLGMIVTEKRSEVIRHGAQPLEQPETRQQE
jgi:hypothetical protein